MGYAGDLALSPATLRPPRLAPCHTLLDKEQDTHACRCWSRPGPLGKVGIAGVVRQHHQTLTLGWLGGAGHLLVGRCLEVPVLGAALPPAVVGTDHDGEGSVPIMPARGLVARGQVLSSSGPTPGNCACAKQGTVGLASGAPVHAERPGPVASCQDARVRVFVASRVDARVLAALSGSAGGAGVVANRCCAACREMPSRAPMADHGYPVWRARATAAARVRSAAAACWWAAPTQSRT